MTVTFYIAAAIALVATVMAISRLNAVHALLYFIVSLFSVAVIFYMLGAPFAAALEVIIYASAIMVLFVFAVMLLNLGPESAKDEAALLRIDAWLLPGLMTLVLFAEFAYLLLSQESALWPKTPVVSKEVGRLLFGPYLLGVELASLLLMAGLIGAYHLGRRPRKDRTP